MKNNKVLKKGCNHSSESGAIMLEVIAVLSLMALMGAALFRQIYLRNQELSNVQMASEIRVVKEAFASWIQAHPGVESAYDAVVDPDSDAWIKLEAMNPSHIDKSWKNISDLKTNLQTYLPVAYDTAGILEDYALFVRCISLGDFSSRCYGLVVPYENTLPEDEDWNFRRAAHVAMLIGADGGVYGADLTDTDSVDDAYTFAGSMGSWTEILDASQSFASDVLNDLHSKTTYAATTGMDIFQPEIELPSVDVGLEEDARLALERVHVYGAFTAGLDDKDSKTCYEIKHIEADPTTGTYKVKNDRVFNPPDSSCWPAFYVESGEDVDSGTGKITATGNVRVANDLSVGYDFAGADAGKAAMRFDKNGMIVFEKASEVDPQTGNDINYVLDPQYTSVMNDIKIMSRGGAKLSEILPNYILKSQILKIMTPAADNDAGPNYEIALPNCPSNYKKALALIPISFGAYAGLQLPDSVSVSIDPLTNTATWNTSFDRYRVYFKLDKSANAVTTSTVYWEGKYRAAVEGTSGNSITINVGYFKPDTPKSGPSKNNRLSPLPEPDEEILAIVQTYCVFDEENFKATSGEAGSSSACEAKGWKWVAGECYKVSPSGERTTTSGVTKETGGRENLTADDCGKITTKGTCELMGCTWNTSGAGSCGS